jgi:CheY-like chemotaxis protein
VSTSIHHICELVNRGKKAFSIGPRAIMETILLVDDNPLRAAMRQSLLEGSAPTVVRVLDAAEALCMVESPDFASNLALVITGHVMTGISGPEFVSEFRSRVPEVPVLVMSAVSDFERGYQGIGGVYFSQTKSPDELRALVNRLLSNGQRRTA